MTRSNNSRKGTLHLQKCGCDSQWKMYKPKGWRKERWFWWVEYPRRESHARI